MYFDMNWRWRNFPKVLIAQVQGKAIGGGMMLLSACDLIVASEDALFSDPTVNGYSGRRVFRLPVGHGPAQGEGVPLYRRLLHRAGAARRRLHQSGRSPG